MSLYEDGSVWYSRYYGYNLGGSRAMVMRDDAVNGSHWDVYAYDPVSGRLASVTDTVPEPDVVHQFAWNPEGTLARWSNNEPNSYARVFEYDKDGRLKRIARDYGSGDVQVAYEYGYNSDGVRVWKRDGLAGQEYRYVCGIGCGGVPMRLYNRVMSGGSWTSVEDYLDTDSALGYGYNWQYRHTGGEFLMMTASGEPSAYYPMDSNGLAVQNAPAQPCVCPVFAPAQTAVCSPLGYGGCDGQVPEVPPYPPVGGGDSGCGGKGSGSSPDSWCERNKSNPTPVNCQDCCDEKVLERVKDLPKHLCKKLKKCIEQQCRDTDPEARLECFKGCLVSTLGEWKAFPLLQKIKRYLECCYRRCLPNGKFDPPDPCKLPF